MKKTTFFSALLLFIAVIVPHNASAYDFKVGSIYYYITGDGTVSVTYKDNNYNSYSGSINIPANVTYNGTTYRVTEIGSSAFRACTDLVAVNIPNTVTNIGYASFYNSRALTDVNIPNSVTYIDTFAFLQCTGLTEITIPGSVAYTAGQVFQNCTGLKHVYLSEGLLGMSAGLFMGCTSLESIVIPNTVTDIYLYVFSGCTSLTDVTIPSSVTYIDSDAFKGTPWLDNQPDGLMYAGNIAYRYIGTMPSGTTISLREGTVAIASYLFTDQDGLVGINIPASVTHVWGSCFANCQNLSSIKVASGNTTFDSRNNCNAVIETATNKLVAGCNVTKIPTSVTDIGPYAFTYCNGLTSIQLNNNIQSIGNYAFSYCSNLPSVEIPASVTSIGEAAFAGCDKLASMEVASGNTTYDSREGCTAIIETATNTLISGCPRTFIPESVTAIGYSAFYRQYQMSSITIPATVTQIKGMAFYNMNDLTTIVCEATTPPEIDGSTFDPATRARAIVYVPRDAINTYLSTDVWNWFGDMQFRPIDELVNGDVDGNGSVSIGDVTALIDYLLNNHSSGMVMYNAGCDKDKKITIGDISHLIDMLLNN